MSRKDNVYVSATMVKAECFGFTADEVRALCAKFHRNYDEFAEWYDGYQIGGCVGMFNPTLK